MKQILEVEESATIPENVACSWYRKSHHRYEPSEQITRDYKAPYDKFTTFGKLPRCHGTESRVKKLLTWINHEPVTLVDRRQANFIKRTRPFVGQVKNLEGSCLYAKIVHGKKTPKDAFDASDAFRDSDLNEQVLFWWQCLQNLHVFRRKLKNRVPEVSFFEILQELHCLDKKHVGVLPEDEIFKIFENHRIFPNKKFFMPLIDTLQIRGKDKNFHYEKLLDLLNWKRRLPVLPKTKQASSASSDYTTTYGESIGNIQRTGDTEVRAAGRPTKRTDFQRTTVPRADKHLHSSESVTDMENLGDQQKTTVRDLISSSTFAERSLIDDVFKKRDKEEMRSIFENIGYEFPDDSFDTFWQKGLRKDRTGGVCVETFRELLAASESRTKETCE